MPNQPSIPRPSLADASEIYQGGIISANSIIKRFQYIVRPLLDKAWDNFLVLATDITSLTQHPYNTNVPDYYTFINRSSESQLTSNYVATITALYDKLYTLEQNWGDIASGYTGSDLDKHNPLHVKKKSLNLTPAAGKVRKNDFIAAYNFKGFLDSLYALTSDMRNISFKVYYNGVLQRNNVHNINVVGVEDKSQSYRDINIASSPSVAIPESSTAWSNATYDFSDYILNEKTRGNYVYTPDENTESDSGEHGYVKPDRNLIPNTNIAARLLGCHVNTNVSGDYKFGHQTINHLQTYSNPSTSPSPPPSADLRSYYNWPNRRRAWSTFYTTDPSSGIAQSYLSLKPAHKLLTDNKTLDPEEWDEVVNKLSTYFHYNTTDKKNVILSTPQRTDSTHYNVPRQIIKAKTVNDLFTEMNSLLVRISATLFGEYTLRIDNGPVPEDRSPKGGFGYPMMTSWYCGQKDDSAGDYCGNSLGEAKNHDVPADGWSEGSHGAYTRFIKGALNNGCPIASEDYSRNERMRAGLLYLDTDISLTMNEFTSLVSTKHSSVVPVTYNLYRITVTENAQHQKTYTAHSDLDNALPGIKKSMLTDYIFENSSQTIVANNQPYTDATSQIYNRYCLNQPLDMTTYLDDMELPAPNLNVNTKYIFMPYMGYLNTFSATASQNNYNGTYINSSGTKTTCELDIGNSGTINNYAGIPVLYQNRDDIWIADKITSVPKNDENLGKDDYGTIQLRFDLHDEQGNVTASTYITGACDVNYVEYVISCGKDINEVNYTHDAHTRTSGYISWIDTTNTSRSGTFDDSHSYGSWDSAATINGPWDVANGNGVTSYWCYGLNDYTSKGNSDPRITDLLSSSIVDLMHMSYGKRFKFNDFYNNHNPLSKSDLKIEVINPYFAIGGNNDYVQGNSSKVIAWRSKVDGKVSAPYFSIKHQLVNEETGEHWCDKAIWANAIVQGNFIVAGNQSDIMNVTIDDGTGTVTKDYHYSIIPQPDPLEISSITLNKQTGSPNKYNLIIKGTCNHVWNNFANAEFIVKAKNGSSTSSTTFALSNSTYANAPSSSLEPYKVYPPATTTYTLTNSDYSNSKITVSYRNRIPKCYHINVSVDLGQTSLSTILDGYTTFPNTNVSCFMRLTNENGGFRDMCNSNHLAFAVSMTSAST